MKVFNILGAALCLVALSQPVLGEPPRIVDFNNSLNMFTVELYNKIDESKPENIFFSPTSVAQVLGMLLTGSQGVTENELKNVLTINRAREYSTHNLNKLFRKTYNKLFNDSRGHNKNIAVLANRMFVQENYEIYKEYQENLTTFFDAATELVNFGNPTEATARINEWISTKTEGMIEDLISEDHIGALTRLVLVNAIYFKASWLNTMEATDDITHFGYSKEPNPGIRYMKARFFTWYQQLEGVTCVEVPYTGGEEHMLIMMPHNKAKFDTFSNRVNLMTYMRSGRLNNRRRVKVILTMPKFEIEQQTNMKDILFKMGVKSLFDQAEANLSKIAEESLHVSDFLHEAKIRVDEKGTVAAGASAAIVTGRSAARPIKNIIVDKPFLLAIIRRGFVLFFGKVGNPSLPLPQVSVQ